MKPWVRRAAAAVGLAIVAVLPLVVSRTMQQILVSVGIFGLLSLGLNVVVGQAGLLDLGYVAFYAIGAYTTAILLGASPWQPPWGILPLWAVFVAGFAFSMLAGFLLGLPVLRLRGDYLAIVTLGFGEIVRIIAVNAQGLTRGARGLNSIPVSFGVDPKPYFYLLLVIILGMAFVLDRLDDSRIGRAWVAIREDEVAAEAMGVNTLRMKLLAFAIGAGTASFAGVVQATKAGSINPARFTVLVSIIILAQVVLGGMGNKLGVIIGAAIITGLPETSAFRRFEDWRFVVFGALLVVMMIYRPQGIVPSRRRARELLHASSVTAAPPVGGEDIAQAGGDA